MICMAQSRFVRLVTCGAPATAAMRGDAVSRATSSLSASGCTCVSASVTADEVVLCACEAQVEPVGLPAVDRIADDLDSLVAFGSGRCDSHGRVARPVVEDEHLQEGVVDGTRRRDATGDHLLLVVSGDQQRHARPAAGRSAARVALVEHPEEQSAGNPDGRRDDWIEPDEREQDELEVREVYWLRSSRTRSARRGMQERQACDERDAEDEQRGADRVAVVADEGDDTEGQDPEERADDEEEPARVPRSAALRAEARLECRAV